MERIFDSLKMYVFSFGLLLLITVEKLRELTMSSHSIAFRYRFNLRDTLVNLITVLLAIYLVVLLRKVVNRLEKVAILLIEALCGLWFLGLLKSLGIGWAAIPGDSYLVLAIYCAASVLAGIRTAQLAWPRVHASLRGHGE